VTGGQDSIIRAYGRALIWAQNAHRCPPRAV
jgi:hypothetical protein